MFSLPPYLLTPQFLGYLICCPVTLLNGPVLSQGDKGSSAYTALSLALNINSFQLEHAPALHLPGYLWLQLQPV